MKTRTLIIIISAFTFIFSGVLFYVYPTTNPDGPWYLSHTFSILNDHYFKSTFAHAYMGIYNLPYMYGWANTIFYGLFRHSNFLIYSIFFWNWIMILAVLFTANYFFEKTRSGNAKALLFTVSFLLTTFTYYARPEIEVLPILFFLYYLLVTFKNERKNIFLVAMTISVIGLMHPVGGLYAGLFFLCYSLENKFEIKFILANVLFVIVFVLILYGPVVLYDFQLWKLNFFQRAFGNDARGSKGVYPITHFFTFSPVLFIYLFLILFSSKKENILKEILLLLLFLFALLPFARGYYYLYLFHLIFWRTISIEEIRLNYVFKLLFAITIFVGVGLNFLIKTFQFLENKSYWIQYKKDLGYLRNYVQNNTNKTVWVSEYCSMSVIDYPNSRLHMKQYEGLSGTKPVFDTSQVFFIENKSMLSYISQYNISENDSIITTEVYPQVKGLRRLTLKEERSEPIGLWKVTVVKK